MAIKGQQARLIRNWTLPSCLGAIKEVPSKNPSGKIQMIEALTAQLRTCCNARPFLDYLAQEKVLIFILC